MVYLMKCTLLQGGVHSEKFNALFWKKFPNFFLVLNYNFGSMLKFFIGVQLTRNFLPGIQLSMKQHEALSG